MLTLFGAAAVTVMMICYAFESRHRGWTLGFAAACLAASAYGWLAGTWPFGVVEAVWAVVALAKWHNRLLPRGTVSLALAVTLAAGVLMTAVAPTLASTPPPPPSQIQNRQMQTMKRQMEAQMRALAQEARALKEERAALHQMMQQHLAAEQAQMAALREQLRALQRTRAAMHQAQNAKPSPTATP